MSENPTSAPVEPPEIVRIFRNPAARTYLLISAGGLLATCMILYFFFFSLPGAIVLLLMGVATLLLRWTITTGLFAAFLPYFLLCPIGIPLSDFFPSFSQIPDRYFNFADLIVVAAALVHLLAAYRYHSAVVGGMPFEAKKLFVKPGVKPTVRPALPIVRHA